MKKLCLVILAGLFLVGCVNDWSVSGVPGMYEGQSFEKALSTLKKNNWKILKQEQFDGGDIGIIASGPPTKQFAQLTGTDCRAATFIFLKKEGLQRLQAVPCETLK